MTDFCVRAENLSKRFYIRQSPNTALQTLKGIFGGGIPRKELWALHDVSFEIQKGQKVALIGKNGSGKTTLLRILAGIYDATSGDMQTDSEPRILFSFLAGLNGDLSVLDNLFLFGAIHGIPQVVLKKRAQDILRITELEPFKYSPLKELSRGQRQRLTLGVFFETTSDFLIFDEEFNFIDQEFLKNYEPQLRKCFSSEKTVIVASHDIVFLKKYCEKALWLHEGKIRMFGSVDDVFSNYYENV